MPRAIHDPRFGTIDIEFESDYSLAESVQRLQDATKGPTPAIRGTVAETYVSIHRANPPMMRDFRPWFFGKFVVVRDRVVLRGSYAMHDGARVVLAIWLAICALALYRTVDDARYGLGSHFMSLIPLAMAGLGFVVMWLGRRATMRDPEWISDVIWSALKLPL